MKIVLKVLPIIFLANMNFLLAQEAENKIGHEYIESSEYPRFSVFGQYGFNQSGKILGPESIQAKLKGMYAGGLAFEVPLYKYFAAGANISIAARDFKKFEPIISRFSLFAKPKISIFNRLTFFTRFNIGLDCMLFHPLLQLGEAGSAATKQKITEKFGAGLSYSFLNPGVNASATIGIEYFPFSRIGFAVEWGFRADIFHIRSSRLFDRFTGPERIEIPKYFNYLVYDMPLIASIQIIL